MVKKDENFHTPLQQIMSAIVYDFVLILSRDIEESGCAVCGKLTPICEMEELSEIENVSLLKVDGVTRKADAKAQIQSES